MYPGRVTPELQRQGWEVHGVALAGSRVAGSFRAAGVEPLAFRSRLAALLSVYKLLRYLKEHDIRVVHAHKSSDMRIGALLVALRPEIRLFFTDHMGVKKPKKDLYHRWAYSKLTKLFSISKATYARNLNAFPLQEDRVHQLYYGIELSQYGKSMDAEERDQFRSSLGIPPGAMAIALPGRISPGKGHITWIKSLKYLHEKKQNQSLKALIIGEVGSQNAGYLLELKELIAEAGLQSAVSFCGFREDLPKCLMAMDVVCIPSSNEAFGLSVIEAMAAGAVVVGSNSGAIPELLGEGRGYVADPDDFEQWGECLIDISSSWAVSKHIAKAGKDWVMVNFGMDKHVKALGKEYKVGV